ncbi:hypothetical protein FACS189421_06790 [Bacteroidia bacterium]|nr:hypothetical protein FACS189421_06790 [Bacteroidia bacterium]
MVRKIYTPKRAKFIGFWQIVAVTTAIMLPARLFSAYDDYMGSFQTVYTETPVSSYLATPKDVNFVPETGFMQRVDSLNYDDNIAAMRAAELARNPGVMLTERPAVVCRNFGCTRLNERITRTFLFNSLANAFMMNSQSRIYFCEADPFSRSCLQSGISFPSRVGIANAMIKIPKATIQQVNLSPGMSKATIGITYEFLANGIDVRCKPTVMDIVVPVNSQATLANREFSCALTADGSTNISFMMNVDYIDLDYGIIGGYYSLGMQGSSIGGGTGYLLIKLEYTGSGVRMQAANNGDISTGGGASMWQSGTQVIQPGEFAVEPLGK